jgi:hypothetical protein
MILLGKGPTFSASRSVAFYTGATHAESSGGLALWHPSVHGFEELLAQVFRISFHAPMVHPAQSRRNPL